ncbi:glycosyltransferase family 4 protein [Yersinia mollaretii]|uniref:glycosyltransferase family 4 protein n=1 Tax=Yersinia mollaretii TaxID=33060 RepID=UPI0025AB37DD|nr:glycosyltransferase family 4 protein [Yersinia mollaretii]MDN0109162.1 glycosyltransferase family 4 protein [Yersinia mollaretii]
MRLALLVDDYLPHSTRVAAKMMHELALELVSSGHEPIVITPAKDCLSNARLYETSLDGVTVWYFKSGELKDIPNIKRAINESLLSLNAWRAVSSKLKNDNKFDGIIYYSPSIFFGPIVKLIKKRCNCKSYLILRDSFPQWIIDEGLIKDNSLLSGYFRFFEKINYSAADYIGLMSKNNKLLFEKDHPSIKNTNITYNWACPVPIKNLGVSSNFRKKNNLVDKVLFFYGGNIGRAQDISNILRLSKRMKKHPQAFFLFIGQGDEVELLKESISKWNLNNVMYLPSVNQLEFKKILSEADVGLFSLAKTHRVHNFPGKLLGYMVESIPILGSVNEGNDLLDIINKSESGYAFINGDDDNLYMAAKSLLFNELDRRHRGEMSRKILHEKFSVNTVAEKIIRCLESDTY